MDLAVAVHGLSRELPTSERFELGSQMRRAAASVPANIAEGHGRRSRRDCARFIGIARGSLMELRTHVQLAVRLDYLPRSRAETVLTLADEVGRMLSALQRALRSQPRRAGEP